MAQSSYFSSPSDTAAVKKKTGRRFRVWWHYNKIAFLIVTASLLLIAFIVIYMLREKQPDYKIAIVGSQEVPLDTAEALKNALLPYARDCNEDGSVIVSVSQYVVNFDRADDQEDAYDQMASIIKLSVDLQEEDGCYLLFMSDPEGFERETFAFTYLDGSCPASEDEAVRWQEMCLAWTDCPVLMQMDLGRYHGYTLMDDLEGDSQDVMADYYLAFRKDPESGANEHSRNARQLFEQLIDGHQ